jgi:GNAT superfamily N-acetyltransferase
MQQLNLPNGYYELPAGKLVNVVTCLEMHKQPERDLARLEEPYRLLPFAPDDLVGFRRVFKKVGEDWMWFSRLFMADEKLAGILGDPKVKSFALCKDDEEVGLLELDFREKGQCELSFFGLAADAIGRGLGRALMDECIAMAWNQPITRMWVHTCTFDSPTALPFYIRSGFSAYARMIEVHDDARLTGHLPVSASPHVPLLTGR